MILLLALLIVVESTIAAVQTKLLRAVVKGKTFVCILHAKQEESYVKAYIEGKKKYDAHFINVREKFLTRKNAQVLRQVCSQKKATVENARCINIRL